MFQIWLKYYWSQQITLIFRNFCSLKHGIQRKYVGDFVESRTLKSQGAKDESSEKVLA